MSTLIFYGNLSYYIISFIKSHFYDKTYKVKNDFLLSLHDNKNNILKCHFIVNNCKKM